MQGGAARSWLAVAAPFPERLSGYAAGSRSKEAVPVAICSVAVALSWLPSESFVGHLGIFA